VSAQLLCANSDTDQSSTFKDANLSAQLSMHLGKNELTHDVSWLAGSIGMG
jgi:hypothetical protein